MSLLGVKTELPSINAEPIFHIGNFPVVNSYLMLLLITFVIIGVAIYGMIKFSPTKPGKLQSLLEIFYEAVYKLVKQMTGSEKRTRAIFPLIATLFAYIGISNFSGFIPGLTNITYHEVPIFRKPSSDFNMTFGLAFSMILLIQVISISEWGIIKYIERYFPVRGIIHGFRKGIKDGLIEMIHLFIGFLELIGEFAKIMSLSLRLFGNMFAGEMLTAVILGGVAYIVPVLWLGMDVLAALVQTIVFCSLVMAYYMIAIKPEEDETGKKH